MSYCRWCLFWGQFGRVVKLFTRSRLTECKVPQSSRSEFKFTDAQPGDLARALDGWKWLRCSYLWLTSKHGSVIAIQLYKHHSLNSTVRRGLTLLDRVCFRRTSIFKFSIVKYTDHVVTSSWCCVRMILSIVINNEIIVTFSNNRFWIFHHQSIVCISLYILTSSSIYWRIEA
jgi:hypothetical protein